MANDTTAALLEPSIQKTDRLLVDLVERLHLEGRREAYHVLRSVLHTLRDRLTVEEAADFSAQLPLVVRGVFYEAWRPAGLPKKSSRDEFMQTLEEKVAANVQLPPQQLVEAVGAVLSEQVTEGEMQDVLSTLPDDIASVLRAT